jgi:hypothetical protein
LKKRRSEINIFAVPDYLYTTLLPQEMRKNVFKTVQITNYFYKNKCISVHVLEKFAIEGCEKLERIAK